MPENESCTPAAASPTIASCSSRTRTRWSLPARFRRKQFRLHRSKIVRTANAAAWPAFWNNGGAIDLSQSRDPRWKELERRIVLSQYQLAAQSAGDQPPCRGRPDRARTRWRAKWHFEMLWWHLAHYSLWNRREMSEKALSIYTRILPVARAIAGNFDYKGLMWPKTTGPDGFNDGFPPEMALLWKQPHPIFFAELDYRANPNPRHSQNGRTSSSGTADFMADYPGEELHRPLRPRPVMARERRCSRRPPSAQHDFRTRLLARRARDGSAMAAAPRTGCETRIGTTY